MYSIRSERISASKRLSLSKIVHQQSLLLCNGGMLVCLFFDKVSVDSENFSLSQHTLTLHRQQVGANCNSNKFFATAANINTGNP